MDAAHHLVFLAGTLRLLSIFAKHFSAGFGTAAARVPGDQDIVWERGVSAPLFEPNV
jgi:hypothetical protein